MRPPGSMPSWPSGPQALLLPRGQPSSALQPSWAQPSSSLPAFSQPPSSSRPSSAQPSSAAFFAAFFGAAFFLAAFFAAGLLRRWLLGRPSSPPASWLPASSPQPSSSSPASWPQPSSLPASSRRPSWPGLSSSQLPFQFSLIKLQRAPHRSSSIACGDSPPEGCPAGLPAPRFGERGCVMWPRLRTALVPHGADLDLHGLETFGWLCGQLYSQDSAPPDWYSMTRVSKKLRSFFRSIISLIQGNGFSSCGKSVLEADLRRAPVGDVAQVALEHDAFRPSTPRGMVSSA